MMYNVNMTKAEKLLKKFLSKPKDLTYDELVQVLKYFGYSELTTGKTTGSAKKFKNENNDLINFHKPHPGNIIKGYAMKQVLEDLTEAGFIK